jgi:hypothetical protein
MSDGRKPKFKEPIQDLDLPQVKVELESEAKAPLTVEQIYLKRQAEVAQQDNEAFSDYLRKKAARDEQETAQAAAAPQAASVSERAPKKLNRRACEPIAFEVQEVMRFECHANATTARLNGGDAEMPGPCLIYFGLSL